MMKGPVAAATEVGSGWPAIGNIRSIRALSYRRVVRGRESDCRSFYGE